MNPEKQYYLPARDRSSDDLSGTPFDDQVLAKEEEKRLVPLQEDLAEWASELLDVKISADTFIEVLADGVYVCHLAEVIQNAASGREQVTNGIARPKWKSDAKPGNPWFARDNTASFLAWCREMGLKQEVLFESDDLVDEKRPRQVVLCLLELARLGSKFGIKPPCLVQMENDIETEEKIVEQEQEEYTRTGLLSLNNVTTPAALLQNKRLTMLPHQSLPDISEPCSIKDSRIRERTVSDGDIMTQNLDLSNAVPSGGRQYVDGMAAGDSIEQVTTVSSWNGSRVKSASKRQCSGSKLDEEVTKLATTHRFPVNRISEGKYLVGRKIVLIRLLKDRHVMVRVGGGWDTFEHFLSRHEPTKVTEFKRYGLPQDKFLFAQGNYKKVTA